MAQINLVGNALTGSTGSGTFVGATSPVLVTPTIGAATATTVAYNSAPSTSTVSGEIFTGTAGESLVFGNVVYIKSDGKLWKANAGTAALFPSQFMCIATISANNTGLFIKNGFATLSSWTWTVGAPLFLSTTSGGMVQPAPEATGVAVQALGYAMSSTTVSFNPSVNYTINVHSTDFISSWNTANAGTSGSTQITVPTTSTGTYNCKVDWGDGTFNTITTYNDAAWTHTYASSGTYTVRIQGTFVGLSFNNGGDRLKLLNISQWGSEFRLGTTEQAYFYGCSNLTITATDNLILAGTTRMDNAFRLCTSITTIPSINTWDFSAVTRMIGTFLGMTSFNQALSFNTISATSWTNAFQTCTALNSALSFSMASATDINSMFNGCTIFNSAIPIVPSSVTNMSFMFQGCAAFNQSIASINSSNTTNFSSMFSGCTAFNQSISTLDTSKGTLLLNMFQNCSAFNQPVTNLVQAAATDASVIFSGCTLFNQDVSSWVTTNVTNFSTMFRLCAAFNQSVSAFNTAKATSMVSMFQSATSFNQAVSTFNTALVTNMTSMFNGATAFNQDVSGWSIAALTNATTMFTSSGFAITNYNLLLDSVSGWPSQATINNSVTFSAGSAHYSGANAIAGRAVLTSTHSWTITDGGTP